MVLQGGQTVALTYVAEMLLDSFSQLLMRLSNVSRATLLAANEIDGVLSVTRDTASYRVRDVGRGVIESVDALSEATDGTTGRVTWEHSRRPRRNLGRASEDKSLGGTDHGPRVTQGAPDGGDTGDRTIEALTGRGMCSETQEFPEKNSSVDMRRMVRVLRQNKVGVRVSGEKGIREAV